jgi:hypothetical protein
MYGEPQLYQEIAELHDFFQSWFSGSIAQSEANFARVTTALEPSFTLIGPDGGLSDYTTVIGWLRGGYGARPGFRLWTEQITLRQRHAGLWLATYVEGQEIDGRVNQRLSSALFCAQPSAPRGLAWLHVHETWLPAVAIT